MFCPTCFCPVLHTKYVEFPFESLEVCQGRRSRQESGGDGLVCEKPFPAGGVGGAVSPQRARVRALEANAFWQKSVEN